jgi:hypothetical protein
MRTRFVPRQAVRRATTSTCGTGVTGISGVRRRLPYDCVVSVRLYASTAGTHTVAGSAKRRLREESDILRAPGLRRRPGRNDSGLRAGDTVGASGFELVS